MDGKGKMEANRVEKSDIQQIILRSTRYQCVSLFRYNGILQCMAELPKKVEANVDRLKYRAAPSVRRCSMYVLAFTDTIAANGRNKREHYTSTVQPPTESHWQIDTINFISFSCRLPYGQSKQHIKSRSAILLHSYFYFPIWHTRARAHIHTLPPPSA